MPNQNTAQNVSDYDDAKVMPGDPLSELEGMSKDSKTNDNKSEVVDSTNSLPSLDTLNPSSQGGLVEKTKTFLNNKGKESKSDSDSISNTNDKDDKEKSVRGMTSLLDALAVKGLISESELKSIKFESVSMNKPVEELVLTKAGVVDDDVQRVRAEMHGVGFVDLSSLSIDSSALNLISQEVAEKNNAVVFEESANSLKVAMDDPLDLQKVQFLQSLTGKRIEAYYASLSDLKSVIGTKYGAQINKEVDEALASVSVYEVDTSMDARSVEDESEEAPVIRIVNMILDYAAKHNTSDIHIEPRENKVGVRYRVHGVLAEKLTIPRQLASPVITRIKILSNMKIDEHRIPQDGRFQIKVEEKVIDLRVSVIPTVYGEKVVMRLLEKGGKSLKLEQTGLRGPSLKNYKDALDKTQGLILVTGPTGSGKTQTLASSLNIVNTIEVNTMTLEDPVEIRVDGVNQVQINSEVGLTFASGLRSFLRQDPDIIMVGEIRDSETAKLAVEAALTGHLVLATLHTNSAAGALPRLVEMGVEPYLLSSTINVVLAQRLVRTINEKYIEKAPADAYALEKLHEALDPLNGVKVRSYDGEIVNFDRNTTELMLARPNSEAGESGFSGRRGIFEALEVTEQIRSMIITGSSVDDIRNEAKTNGMISMSQDGFIKVLEGITTVEEVLRVVN